MAKYFIRRVIHGLISAIIVVAVVMILVYSLMNRNLIFAQDSVYRNLGNNKQEAYKYRKWDEYGYIDYLTYNAYLRKLVNNGEITDAEQEKLSKIGHTEADDKPEVAEYVAKFKQYCAKNGYTVKRLDAIMITKRKYANGGEEQLFAYKDRPLIRRMVNYFTHLITVDTVHSVKSDSIKDSERKITFTLHDPVYGGKKFSPAIMGYGTHHRYLLYFDKTFPYIHQNLFTINLGTSYAVNKGRDVFETMNTSQGSYVNRQTLFPSGKKEKSADNLHTAVFVSGSQAASAVNKQLFVDDYTSVQTFKRGFSKVGYSFLIGIIAVALAYAIGIPLGISMARHKDKLVDKLGTIYIVFIIAVPSLAYIFLFKAIGGLIGLPTIFDMDSSSKLMYVLPIISLALPQIGDLMKWLRRYMIDQMNSDYVKFARSGGLSEKEIFNKHILKNASIPIIHNIPAGVLSALVGAIITERVYTVPGAGNLLTTAINTYDNGVIVGVTLFYAILSVISIIAGDILMSIVDPRISYSSKAR